MANMVVSLRLTYSSRPQVLILGLVSVSLLCAAALLTVSAFTSRFPEADVSELVTVEAPKARLSAKRSSSDSERCGFVDLRQILSFAIGFLGMRLARDLVSLVQKRPMQAWKSWSKAKNVVFTGSSSGTASEVEDTDVCWALSDDDLLNDDLGSSQQPMLSSPTSVRENLPRDAPIATAVTTATTLLTSPSGQSGQDDAEQDTSLDAHFDDPPPDDDGEGGREDPPSPSSPPATLGLEAFKLYPFAM